LASNGQRGLCWAHDPRNAERRRRTASRGGKAKANKEVATIKAEIQSMIAEVRTGSLPTTEANTIGRLYAVLLDYIRLERQVYVEDDLAVRIEELKRGSGTDAS